MWDFYEQAFGAVPVHLVGHNPGMESVRPAENWDDLKRLLSQHRFYIHTADPRYEDGYDIPMLEAMAVGKPVICTPVGAHREVIRDGINGFVVKTGSAKQLAEKTVTLLTNKDLHEEISQTNASYVRRCFSADRIVTQFTNYVWEVYDHKSQDCRATNGAIPHEIN